MRIDDLKKVYQARPFKPFIIRDAVGRAYQVAHPEYMAISPSERSVVVFTPKTFSKSSTP
jgi:hypothetical protein